MLHIQKSGARLGHLLSVTPWQFSEACVSVERVQLNGSLRPLGPCVFHPRTVLREGLLHDLGIIILTQMTQTYPILDRLLALQALAEWL